MVSDRPVILSVEQAVSLLPDGDIVHVIIDAGWCKLAAGWERSQVLELIHGGAKCEVGGEQCRRYDHGLVVWRDGEPLFVANRDGVDWEALEVSDEAE